MLTLITPYNPGPILKQLENKFDAYRDHCIAAREKMGPINQLALSTYRLAIQLETSKAMNSFRKPLPIEERLEKVAWMEVAMILTAAVALILGALMLTGRAPFHSLSPSSLFPGGICMLLSTPIILGFVAGIESFIKVTQLAQIQLFENHIQTEIEKLDKTMQDKYKPA